MALWIITGSVGNGIQIFADRIRELTGFEVITATSIMDVDREKKIASDKIIYIDDVTSLWKGVYNAVVNTDPLDKPINQYLNKRINEVLEAEPMKQDIQNLLK